MMNTSFAKKSFLFVALALCFSSMMVKADELITWDSDKELGLGLNAIIAANENIFIDITNDIVVRGNDCGESQLLLRAEVDRVITFSADNNLTFKGSCNENKDPLVIIVTGPGQVVFNFAGGKTVSFDGATACGPTYVYVAPLNEAEEPTLCFNRSSSDDGHTRVLIGKDSLMGFAYTTDVDAGESALIKFDPTYDNDLYVEDPCQRMILEIENCGAFIHTGRRIELTEAEIPCCELPVTYYYFTSTQVDRKDAAGENSRVKVVNSGVPQSDHIAGLLVLNRNCKLFEMLVDPFGNLGAFGDTLEYKGAFSGLQYGYVHGSNATLEIEDEAYFDYVGLCNNKCPDVSCIPGFELIPSKRVLKFRNGSAYWVDGNHDPDALPAKIVLGENAGMFFRSGIDKDGNIVELFGNELDPENAFTVDDPNNLTPGMGEFVFIAEAPLDVMGDNNPGQKSKMEILSLHVNCNGGPLFADDCDNDRTNFPKRTFFTGLGDVDQVCALLSYNKAAFLINDLVRLYDTSLVHSDVLHDVFEKNDLRSQPTYVGGEKWTIFEDVERARFEFFSSRFNVHSDVAITGMDFRVPNRLDFETEECIDNNSMFYFYSNCRKLDDGTGRQMILGTHTGSTACDGCKVISRDAHLDVFQTENCDPYCDIDHKLFLRTSENNECINDCIGDICDCDSLHNIFLGHSSNISVGTHIPTVPLGGRGLDGCPPPCPPDVCEFDCETNPMLKIDGNFFTFSSRGGPLGLPSTTHLTGKGGIFVDKNGMFSIGSEYRASIGTMVTRSLNGRVNLPKEQIHFANHVGIADWRPDMTDEDQRILVEADERISDYTFHWMVTRKNFEEGYDKFCPYIFRSVNICECPEVLDENVSGLPTVEGMVGQFQIQGSRIGDPAHLLVDGGHIRELVFLHTGHGGDAPVATLVVRNNGRVGVGPAHPSPDTLFATTTFGANGITVIADGSGRIDLNEDMIINNRCAFVKGPNYISGEDVLEITSDVPRVLLVKSTATLDFQCFDNEDDIIRFGGQIRMIFEPGSKILMGGGIVQFANDVVVEMDPYVKAKDFFEAIQLGDENPALDPLTATPSASDHNPFAPLTGHGDGLANTDSFRTRIIGTGTIQLVDEAKFYIDKDAFVGIETYKDDDCEICTTNITVELKDSGLFSLGNDRVSQGGSLQIGNTVDRICTQGGNHSVSFTLRLAGLNAKFEMDSQAFFGLNTGIVDRRSDTPNGWLIDVMHNVASITIDLQDGLFEHSDIFAGDNTEAHLLAIGQDDAEGASPLFSFLRESTDSLAEVRLSNANIEGGGNMVRIIRGNGAFKPIVLQDDDTVDVGGGVQHPNMRVSMLASRPLLPDVIGTNVSGDTLFSNLKTTDVLIAGGRSQNKGNASAETEQVNSIVSELRVGVVNSDDIIRQSVFDITDADGGSQPDRVRKAAERGAVNVGLDLSTDPATITSVTQLSS